MIGDESERKKKGISTSNCCTDSAMGIITGEEALQYPE
jgi:hypothetical protein